MSRLISAAAIAGIFAGLSNAQTLHAPDSHWDWNAELNLNGLKLGKSGNSCFTPDSSKAGVAEILEEINQACVLSNWSEQEDATVFSLTCSGDYAATVSGELFLGENDASLTLAGALTLGDAGPVTLIVNGKAARTGVCNITDEAIPAPQESLPVAAQTDSPKPEPEAEVVEAEVVANAMPVPETDTIEAVDEVRVEVAVETTEIAALPGPALIVEAPINDPIPVSEVH